MHHDEVKARAAGEPSVFGHGMFSAGLLATALTELVGVNALRSFRVRFTRPVRPDEVVTPTITVRELRTDEGGTVAAFDCVLAADAGDVVRGSATARGPA
jgi:acyl dehydratase